MQFLSFPLWYWDFCANLQIRKEYMFFPLGHGLVLVVSQHARSYLRKFCKKCTMVPWVTVKSWVFVVCFFFNDAPLGNFGSSHQVLNGLETLTYPPQVEALLRTDDGSPQLLRGPWNFFWGPSLDSPLGFFFCGIPHWEDFWLEKTAWFRGQVEKKAYPRKGSTKKKISISGFAGIIKFT